MRDQALVAPIRAQARTDVPGALTMARALGDRTARASAVQAVVMRQARDAGVPAALQTVASISDEPAKSAALIGVARVQVERGDGAAAWATLGRVADAGLRASAERAAALTLARAGDATPLVDLSRGHAHAAGRISALAQAAEDVMKSEDELRPPGGSIFLAAE